MYSPALGRFIQPDTIVPDMFNPQSLNRYSYGLNNPSRYTDPSGHIPVDCYGTTYCGASNSDLLPDFKPSKPKPPKPDKPENQELITVAPNAPSCWDYSSYCTTSSGNYSPNLPGWHNYYGFNLVCPAELQCTAADMRNYLSRFAYPGQNPANPILQSGVQSSVTAFGVIPLGDIRTSVSVDGLTIVNVTESNHLMYDGQVVRQAVQSPDGAWYIATTGTGNNYSVGELSLAPINQYLGPIQFDQFDVDMLDYISANQ